MSAGWEVAIALWLNVNVLFVLWRIFRGAEKGDIQIQPIKVRS